MVIFIDHNHCNLFSYHHFFKKILSNQKLLKYCFLELWTLSRR